MTATLDRLPPSDTDAERAALGSLAMCGDDRVMFAKIRRTLWPGAFYNEDHAIVFRVMCDMADAGKPIDIVLVAGELRVRGLLEEVGGAAMLAEIILSMPTAINGPHYAKRVADRARERDAIRVLNGIGSRLTEPHQDGDAADIIQQGINKLWRIATEGRDLKIWTMAEAVERFVAKRKTGKSTAIDVGLDSIDRDYRGVLTLGGYTLVAARPSMGKSTFVRDRLLDRARAGVKVGLIAVEEGEDKIAGNAISSDSGIENSRIAYGPWHESDWHEIDGAVLRLSDLPYFATDSALTLADVLTAAELLSTQHGCTIIAIDHIHLVGGVRSESREQQISEISGAFKELIKRQRIAGVVAAQLSRPEKGTCPPPPQLTDLRGSGALEEHADAALMLHRPDYYMRGRDNYTPDGLCQVLIRKNRNGCVGEVVLRADLAHQRFEDIQQEIPSFS